MKRHCWPLLLLLAGIILLSENACFAQQAAEQPAPDVDGKVWMNSTSQEKKAFLFGAGSALVIEFHLRDKHSELPSKFVRGWVEGLKNMSWTDLSNKIDAYYQQNPDKITRNVFDVIWHDIIAPKSEN